MTDCIINFSLEEMKEILNHSHLPFRFIERVKLNSVFNDWCDIYDNEMIRFLNADDFYKAVMMNKKVRNYFALRRESIAKESFFQLISYDNIYLNDFKDNFIVVFSSELLNTNFLELFRINIYDKVNDIDEDALGDKSKLKSLDFSLLNIGSTNKKTLLLSLNKLRKEVKDEYYKLKIISYRLCVLLKVDNLKSYIKYIYYKNEIIDLNRITL